MNSKKAYDYFISKIDNRNKNSKFICEIYVDFSSDRAELYSILLESYRSLNVDIIQVGTRLTMFTSQQIFIDIEKNGWYDTNTIDDSLSGYLSYRYVLIIVRMPNISQEEYENAVIELSNELKKRNIRNHVSFDYDTKLNG